MSISTGWTPDYVAEYLDLPRLKALNLYWKKNPPVAVLLKAFVGYKEAETGPQQTSEQEANMQEFFASIPQRKFEPPVIR